MRRGQKVPKHGPPPTGSMGARGGAAHRPPCLSVPAGRTWGVCSPDPPAPGRRPVARPSGWGAFRRLRRVPRGWAWCSVLAWAAAGGCWQVKAGGALTPPESVTAPRRPRRVPGPGRGRSWCFSAPGQTPPRRLHARFNEQKLPETERKKPPPHPTPPTTCSPEKAPGSTRFNSLMNPAERQFSCRTY